VENTLIIVFSVHGMVRASSAQPPHRSTTISPSMLKASEAPLSCFGVIDRVYSGVVGPTPNGLPHRLAYRLVGNYN
jgi:hypothetical protein